jgi:MFS family permease
MCETLGLLLGSTTGGWCYQELGAASPFFLEATWLLVASILLARAALPRAARRTFLAAPEERPALAPVLRPPGVVLMATTNAVLIGIQTGIVVFLFPLYLVNYREVGPGLVGVFVILTVLGRLAALSLGSCVSERSGRMRILTSGLLTYAVVLGTLTCFTHPLALGGWSVAAGFVMPLPTALIGDRVPQHLHGVAVGGLRTMTDSGHMLGPLVTGALADAVDLTVPFLAHVAGSTLPWPPWSITRLRRAGAKSHITSSAAT